MISISTLKLYDEQATLNHVKSLAFNRNASSTGETEALNYIEEQLIENDIFPKVEHFNWSGPMRILIRMSYVLIFVYLILFRMFLLIIAYFIIKYMFEKTRNLTFVKKEESKNIFTKISAKENIPNRPVAIISAHYDSVSMNIPYRLQVLIFFIYRVIILFYVIVILMFSTVFLLEYFEIIPISRFVILLITYTSVGGVFVSIPILYLVFVEKPSAGSIDNASGVAVAIELAKILKKNPLEKIDILIIWTGAEEWGLKGSKKFCRQHFKSIKQKYDLNKSFNINIDMVGTYIGLLNKSGLKIRRKMNENLNIIIETNAKYLGIPIVKFNKILRPQSDYKIFKRYARFARRNFQIACFYSSKDVKYIHSSRDTPEKCSAENLNGCLKICYHTLKDIDSKLNSIKKSQIICAV